MSPEEFCPLTFWLRRRQTPILLCVCFGFALCVCVCGGAQRLKEVTYQFFDNFRCKWLTSPARVSNIFRAQHPHHLILGRNLDTSTRCLPPWCYPCLTVTVLDLNASSKVIYHLKSAHVQSPVLHLTRTVANVSHSHFSMTTVTRSCFCVFSSSGWDVSGLFGLFFCSLCRTCERLSGYETVLEQGK